MKSLQIMLSTFTQSYPTSPAVESLTSLQEAKGTNIGWDDFGRPLPTSSISRIDMTRKNKSIAKTGTHSAASREWLKRLVGLIEYQGKSLRFNERKRANSNSKVSLTFQPPPWLCPRRFELDLKRSRQGWDVMLRCYNIVPYEATIFKHCVNGDIVGIQELFRGGLASPFDMDIDNRTALHVGNLYFTILFTLTKR